MKHFTSVRILHLPAAFISCLLAVPTSAAIFLSTADPDFNTTPPTQALAESGWQWQGEWGQFLGTPIDPHHFITAAHVGGSTNQFFRWDGRDYPVVAMADDPGTDLRIWRINGTFSSFAPLYRGTNESGKPLIVFGRGASRGAEVRVTNGPTSRVQGWRWGSIDGRMRWGLNTVDEARSGGPGVGSLLRATFDAGSGANEAHLATGDSGGGVFIEEDGIWKLAAINFAVDGRFNYSDEGEGFEAALFDIGGLYSGGAGAWQFTVNRNTDIPSGFYATRISPRLGWIHCVLGESTCWDSPVLLKAKADPTGAVSLEFASMAGCRYQIEQSNIPQGDRWESLGNEIAGTGGSVTVATLKDGASATRFYRVRILGGAGCAGSAPAAGSP